MSHGQVLEYSEDDSSSSLHMPNWEDRVSACSLSEAEERTIKAVCEQMKVLKDDKTPEQYDQVWRWIHDTDQIGELATFTLLANSTM